MVGINFIREERSRAEEANKRRGQLQKILWTLGAGIVIAEGLLRWDEARCVQEQERLSESLRPVQDAQKALSIHAAQDEVSEREERELQSIRRDSINPVVTLKLLVDFFPHSAILSELFLNASEMRIEAMGTTGGESTRIAQILESLFPAARVQVSGSTQHPTGRGEVFVITVHGWAPSPLGEGS